MRFERDFGSVDPLELDSNYSGHYESDFCCSIGALAGRMIKNRPGVAPTWAEDEHPSNGYPGEKGSRTGVKHVLSDDTDDRDYRGRSGDRTPELDPLRDLLS